MYVIFDTQSFRILTPIEIRERTNMIGDHSGFRSHTVHTSMVYIKQLKYYATLDRTSLNPLPSGSKQVRSILFSSSLKT